MRHWIADIFILVRRFAALVALSLLTFKAFSATSEGLPSYHDLLLIGLGLVFLALLILLFVLIRKNKKLKSNIENYVIQNRLVHDEKVKLEELIKTQEIRIFHKEQLAGVIENSNNAVIITDPEGNIEWVNRGFVNLYGYTIEEFTEKMGDNILAISTNPRAISEGIEHKKPVTFPTFRVDKNGKRIWLQVEFTPVLDSSGNIRKFAFFETDVSLYKITESEILQQREEVDYQLTIAEMQRDKMSSKYKIFTDSINYARRIQRAILPSNDTLDRLLDNFFILYKPRDIVSGDFYWISELEGKTVVSVADCTGHGVPGAFMSILGINFLTEIVGKAKDQNANEILNELRSVVIESLSQSDTKKEAKDGIDMTLCIIDKKNMRMQFAGANSPMYLVRDRKIREIKGDRMPIGVHPKSSQSFTNHELDIRPNDSIYLFTDGYVDQFGWRNGKKFKYQAFRRMILDLYEIPMRGQGIIMDNTIKNWMGELEQVDDILVMGLKV